MNRARSSPQGDGLSAPLPLAWIARSPRAMGALGTASEMEVVRTALLASLMFLAALVFVVGRTARDALFLTQFPASAIAPMWIGYALVSAAVALGYDRLAHRARRARLAITTMLVGAASHAVLRVLVGADVRWAVAFFYLWAEVIANLTLILAWTIANDLHDARSAKRLFGVIGAGRILGTLVCGFATGAVVSQVGTENLLIVLIAALLVAALLVRDIDRRFGLPTGRGPSAPADAHDPRRAPMPLLRSRQVLLLGAMILVLFVVLTVGDFQFKAMVREAYPARDDLARFMANFHGALGAFSLVFQLVVTPRILQRLGVLSGMLVMPAAFLACSVALLVHPSLAVVTLLKFSDNAFQYTVHDSTVQILYFPFSPAVRDRVRAVLDAVVKPLGYGLGGVAVIALAPTTLDATGAGELAAVVARLGYFTIPAALLWIALTPLVRAGYVEGMRRTLMRREPPPAEMLSGASLRAALREALTSAASPRVLFAADRLRELEPGLLREALPELAAHPAPQVRCLALRLTVELDDARGPSLATAALTDGEPSVRAEAVEALAIHRGEDAHETLVRLAHDDTDAIVRDAARAALLRHMGLDGLLAGAPLLRELLESDEPAHRLAAARILGRVGAPGLRRTLARLLADHDVKVRRAAVVSAATSPDARLLPRLVEALADPRLAAGAAKAIAAIGDPAVPTLSARLARASEPVTLRAAIPRVLARIETPAALVALLERLDEPEERVRQKVYASASRLRLALRAPPLPAGRVERLIRRELDEHTRVREDYAAVRPQVTRPLLDEHVLSRLRHATIRMLRLCELGYPRELVASVRAHLLGDDPQLRANAAEVLEATVESSVVASILSSGEAYLELRHGRFPPPAREPRGPEAARWLSAEIRSGDRWRAALALEAVAHHAVGGARDDALDALAHDDPLVREMAILAVASNAPQAPERALAPLAEDRDPVVAARARRALARVAHAQQPEEPMYSTIEKVLFLQGVPLFARVAGDDLADLARLSVVIPVHRGEAIFREGDPGGALYMILSGAVSLRVRGREVATLGTDDVLGETSILDGEPRAATAVATEESELLRVSHDDFHEALRGTVEIAEGVIQVLNRRLRDADRRLAEAGSLPPRAPT